MDNIDYKGFLRNIYSQVNTHRDINVQEQYSTYIDIIANNSSNQRAVFTVLITLLVYKHFHNNQDIRYHQSNMVNGFSGRSFDTKNITPILTWATIYE